MKKFCTPNLPTNPVKDVIVSGEYSFIVRELENLGIHCIMVKPCRALPYYERYHADLHLSCYRKGAVCIGSNTDFSADISALHIERGICLQPHYPENIAFNHVIMGNTFLGNIVFTDSRIIDYCMDNQFRMLNVRQGYTKCSCAVVNENALITADSGIYRKCLENRIDVLKIDSGYINLYGYDYGFIGGCCGKISKDILAFTGKLNAHKNGADIKSFLRNYGISVVELSNKPLFDIGSILPLTEKTAT